MSYELTIMPGTEIALFCWSGPITLEDRKRNVERITQFLSENGISQLILDTRHLDRRMTTTEGYEFGAWVPEKIRGIKVAVVHHSNDVEGRFVENVAANRGTHSRSFLSLEEAQKWLDGK